MTDTPEAGPSSIPLYISNGKAYCWDAQDVANLRVRHRICGLMAGTLPGVSQQNVFLGLPQLLMPEEVVLLVENLICHLVHSPSAHLPPTAAQIKDHEMTRLVGIRSMQEDSVAQQAERQKEFANKTTDSEVVIKKREERKRNKEAAKMKAKARESGDDASGAAEMSSLFTPDDTQMLAEGSSSHQTPATPIKEKAHTELPSNPSDGPAYFTEIPATPIRHPWFSPETTGSVYRDLESARAANVWTYPLTLLERARCASFRKVWEEGYYLGHGVKFGGEFLIYPGDPLRYHSHFVNNTLPSPDTVIRPMELVAWGRLGTATKKAHLICCFDENADDVEKPRTDGAVGKGSVECWSLEWGNFG